MYQYEENLDFHALGREIKCKREEKGWTQEYLAQLVDRTPRSIMYMENRGQHPSLYQPDGILQKAPPAATRQMKLSQGRDFSSEESRPFFIFSKRSGEHDF